MSNNANLSSIVISEGTLVPDFSALTTAYTTSVANGVTSITVTPTTQSDEAIVQIRINSGSYASVASGSPSADLNLNIGDNTIELLVTAENASTQTYILTVTRAASSNALLSNLTISTGSLSPSFIATTNTYTVSVDNTVGSLTVTPTAADGTSTMQFRINGGAYSSITSGSASGALGLNFGANTINILVTAQDASTNTYTITVTRAAASTNALLSSLTLSTGSLNETFSSAATAYTVDLLSDITTITITGTADDSTATVGDSSGVPVALTTGFNPITIVVTAQDGTTTETYTISVFRNGWGKWVEPDKGAVDTDLTFTPEANESVTIVCQSANLDWSKVFYNRRMKVGSTYTVSFTAQSTRDTDLLSVYENDSSYFGRHTILADTPTAITYDVTVGTGKDELGEISFRPYPNLTTGYVEGCTIQITNLQIVEH